MWRTRRTKRTLREARRQARSAAAKAAIAVPTAFAESQTGTVVVVDVAHMGAVNCRYGVDAGDRLLHAIEASLRTHVSNALVTRLPGDQFIVIVPHGRAREQIEDATRLAVSGATAYGCWFRRISTTAHTGSATWTDEQNRQSAVLEAEYRLGHAAARTRSPGT